MNKKFTLLAVALMTVGTFTAASAASDVPSKEWTVGNYYYLKTTDDSYLALDGTKADSVIVKKFVSSDVTKAAIDSALWQISDKQTTLGVTTYKLTNKVTQQVLSFAAKANANTNLALGVDRWVLSENGSTIKGFYDGDKTLELVVTEGKLSLTTGGGTTFNVKAPESAFPLNAQQLGNGFSVFQLKFGDIYDGNIFAGKELLAKDITGKAGYVTLQAKGDESYANGVAKYFGVDTLKSTISGARDVFGYKFALDSTRTNVKPNEACQQFKFTIDLKNDSLAMFVAGTPFDNDTVRVVYASVEATKVLTVSKVEDGGAVEQGSVPYITLSKGTPTTIPTGTGIYFLKRANKDANEGRYYVTSNTYMDDKPSVNLAKGQWYIKETDGKYSIVDRSENTTFASLNSEAFAVQGMANTYTFGSSTDSVTIEFQPVNLNDHYLGSLYFTENELNDNGYVLNLISGTTGVSNIYAYTTDSILKGKVGDAKDAAIFKLIPSDTVSAGGAVTLGDELFVISYKLKGLFNSDTITAQSDSLKFSKSESALSFKFISDATAEKYAMLSSTNQYVGMNVNTSCVQLSEKAAYVNLEAVDAPEYASFASAHKRLAYNNNALAMNPLNFFAEMKDEGNPITKTNYGADNFSLWVEQDTVIAGKQLYFISSGVANGGKAEANIRYYLAAKDTTRAGIDADTYAMFISHDSIKTMKNNPALFAFKTAEEGGYYLENQKELNENGKPYVGVVNGFAVMQATPSAAFEVQTASAPTANEEMNVSEIKVISNDGQVIVTNASGKMITLSNILGQIIGVRRANSEYFSMPATSGIVLVTVEGDATYKVIVK
ncbi:DUF6383 domain-containing protein [Parabacteroides merdae]|mgnify:FL=1|jgi:hypothetical protein|uniref:DUF6383 domain-containing protein n=1 Tax=Parabacteroides merdae TaxID=46503 RepID=UPI001C24A53A|nr:DUF6383 domain-containing protein [Parabacteroides merdae]MBU9059999.1 hypothetical protein [Parabacteroides merdae]MCG4836163.1 DUF6383 domain-containing protein [Parabacteroides merdae]MCQ5194067.1 DUF6383 domain-containing protein [Parabacteroides merdae]